MDFKFKRIERDPTENSERAFIAASRRQDRDYKQRMESLQKASDLHFERTGRRLEVTPTQVAKPGPLMELSNRESKRQREVQRFQPYSYGKTRLGAATRNERTLESKSSQQITLPANQTLTQTTMQPTQTNCEAEERADSLVAFEGYPVPSTINNDTLERNPAGSGDGLQNSDSTKSITTQPEGYVDNKDIEFERSPKSKADIPSLLVESKGWENFCHDAFNAVMDMEVFDLEPSHEVYLSPEPSETNPG